MKTYRNDKREYSIPMIERIELDNEISLALTSDLQPDGEPSLSQAPERFNNDPFKSNIA